MTDYKDTLNLPKTDFPMKANLANREPQIQKRWSEIDLYAKLQAQGADKPMFVLHDGPPYANGKIHLGTTLNKVLKDIVVKSKRLSGFNAPYIPGWDCHGLPIEHKVEKKKGKPGEKLTAKEFRKACRDFAASQVEIQKEDFQRLGVLGDWQNPYLTMSYSYEANVVRALAQIINNGHLQRGQKPVHWCTACSSALAEAEVEYKDKKSPAIDVAFDVIDSEAVAKLFKTNNITAKIEVPIWTTTPWTLPANQAVSMHPEFIYTLVACDIDGRSHMLILAKALLDSTMERYAAENIQVLGEVEGVALENVQLQHPFLDRNVPIILGDHVTTEAGTGNVHTAPAHGIDDFNVGKRYQLSDESPVDSRSCFKDDTPLVGGIHVFKANPVIIDTLKEHGHLLKFVEMDHSYPHCWRHKTPLIFRATPQWFVSMDQKGLREMAMKAIPETGWIPGWGELRMQRMVETRPDWCISRQRTWGIPITLFVHRETFDLHPNTPALMDKVADLIEQGGIDAWYDVDAKDLIGEDAADYEKVVDVLDVWFDSGVSHFCVLEKRPEVYVPADLYLEGSDQFRGWFQTSFLTSLAMRDVAPFKKVLTHGYVMQGKDKMSKSLGNVVSPADVIKKSGADILRLWAAACDHTNDVSFSDEILKRSSDAYRRIRNTARFLLSNLFDFDPATDCVEDLVALDAWAIQRTQALQEQIIEAYESFHFQTIYQLISNFCTVDMGSFFLDITKDRLYTAKSDGHARRSAQTAMYHIVEALVRWLAPILSFTSDEIWQFMPGKRNESVFLSEWYNEFPLLKHDSSLDWTQLMHVRNAVNKVLEAHRKEGAIRSALDARVKLYADEKLLTQLKSLDDELRFLLIVSAAEGLPLASATSVAEKTEIDGLAVEVIVSEDEKCERCWQRRVDVSQHDAGTICQRCEENISASGELRRYA